MEEKDLIKRSKKGDEEAFTILMRRHEAKIYYQCLQFLKDENLAKDLTQETFVQAYRSLSSFRMESGFYTWLYRIAKNLCLNWLRAKKVQEQELKEELLQAPIANTFPEDDLKLSLKEALQTLPLKQQEVFQLFEFQKQSIKEIAAQLNIPSGTVRSRLHYARKNIKKYFKK